jgi:hypothetical protein
LLRFDKRLAAKKSYTSLSASRTMTMCSMSGYSLYVTFAPACSSDRASPWAAVSRKSSVPQPTKTGSPLTASGRLTPPPPPSGAMAANRPGAV